MVAHLMVCSFTVLISTTGRQDLHLQSDLVEEAQLVRIKYSKLLSELILCYVETAILSVVCQAWN